MIAVGRNSVFAVDAETNEVFGWGSNKYGQIFPSDSAQALLNITNLQFKLDEEDEIIASSYFTLLHTRRSSVSSLFSSL